MLLCLNSTEPVARKDGHLEEGDSSLVAAAGKDPWPAEEEAADGSAAAATVSPLQALVQDIMQQQKQRAQVPTLFQSQPV